MCKGCRVKVLQGELPTTVLEERAFPSDELAQGWRLACLHRLEGDLVLELAQWEMLILADATTVSFTPASGVGAAVDLGTTTIVVQVVDRQDGHVRAVASGLNPQARYGGDIMSRIQFEQGEKGVLTALVREEIERLVQDAVHRAGQFTGIQEIVLAGNTAMHHLFCGLDIAPLAVYPFEPHHPGLQRFSCTELGWRIEGNPQVEFLPNLGGFVGSDLLAGLMATRLHESEALIALIDLGTNGEILIGNRDKILCASTAAGPAFEGGRIAMGMRASTGAISSVTIQGGVMVCHTIGSAEPRGICGSGLVDAVACGLELGLIQSNGRLQNGATELALHGPVRLIQKDIRELQLAKAAIAAGIRILLDELGATPDQVETMYLAGAFGNYLNPGHAKRIGLFPFPIEKVIPAGNTSLLGTKICLLNSLQDEIHFAPVLSKIEHIPIHANMKFQEIYVDEMGFPAE
jgi:uncharacterized 2Fe-2S/4Fe-4S cluster protein (DUF4445 family)